MKYCSECGNRTSNRWIAAEGRERCICDGCGKVHYENPKVLVLCLAYWNTRLLVCKRAHDPQYGLWTVPGGFVEALETLEEAACRETFEETGVMVAAHELELCLLASVPHISEVYVGFRAHLKVRPKLRAGAESLDVALLTESELLEAPLAFGGRLADYYRLFFAELRSGRSSVTRIAVNPPSAVCDLNRSDLGRYCSADIKRSGRRL